MRVLHVFHHYRPCIGGIEKVILELNRQLQRQGHECSVLCLNRCSAGKVQLPAKENFPEAKVERISFINLGFYKLAPFSFGRMKEFDIVHVHGLGFFADFLAIKKIFHGKKMVLSTHGGIFHTARLSLLKKIYFFAWCRLVLRAFDKIVAVSEQDKLLFGKIVPKERIALIENGVEVKKFSNFQGNPAKNELLFVGRLSKNKGLKELLVAMKAVKGKRDFKLRVIGSDFDFSREQLRKEINGLGLGSNVEVLGEVDEKELMDAFKKSGVFVSASQYEGFGISAVEAMAAGLVPVLNDIPAFRALVANGENGFIVDFGNSERAGQEIARILGLPEKERKRLGGNARKSAARFDWGAKARAYEKVYAECIGK